MSIGIILFSFRTKIKKITNFDGNYKRRVNDKFSQEDIRSVSFWSRKARANSLTILTCGSDLPPAGANSSLSDTACNTKWEKIFELHTNGRRKRVVKTFSASINYLQTCTYSREFKSLTYRKKANSLFVLQNYVIRKNAWLV